MFRRTKIVATLGPASSDADLLAQLIDAGVNVFRLNFSHGSADDHRAVAARIREQADARARNVAILADLQGPKIRIARFRNGPVMLEPGQPFVIDTALDKEAGDSGQVGTDYAGLAEDCRPGDTLLLNDGLLALSVEDVTGSRVRCRVLVGGELSNNKGINRQGGGLNAQALTDKDREDIKLAASLEVDFLALSFPAMPTTSIRPAPCIATPAVMATWSPRSNGPKRWPTRRCWTTSFSPPTASWWRAATWRWKSATPSWWAYRSTSFVAPGPWTGS